MDSIPDFERYKELLREIQERNLRLVERLDGQSYGANSADSGLYLIDFKSLEDPDFCFDLHERTLKILGNDKVLNSLFLPDVYENIKASDLDQTKVEDYPNSFVSFPTRVNLRTVPIPTEICGDANLFNFRIPEGPLEDKNFQEFSDLTQSGSAFVNTPALVLARANIDYKVNEDNRNEEWLYVRIHNLEGWVPAKEVIPTHDFVMDPIRPLENIEKFGARLGVVKAYGLKVIDDELVLVDPRFANGAIDPDNIPARGEEVLTDGTMRNGENALISLGDTVEIINEDNEYFYVKLPGFPDSLKIEKEFLSRGYLEMTPENIEMVLDILVHPDQNNLKVFAPYGWGGEDGCNYDCSLLVDVLNRIFGLVGGRGADPQRFGIEGSEFVMNQTFDHSVKNGEDEVNYNSTLPLKGEDLPAEVLALYDREKGVFKRIITASCGPHIMVMHSIDSDGNIIYVHSVGFVNPIGVKAKGVRVPAHPVWGVVKGPAIYNKIDEATGDLVYTGEEGTYSWGDSYPPHVGWDEGMRTAWPTTHVVVH
jgi:hypothetical protein